MKVRFPFRLGAAPGEKRLERARSRQAGFSTAAVLSGVLIAGLASVTMYQSWSSTQRTTSALTRTSNNDALMAQARAAIISEHADLDGDGTPEGPAPLTSVTPIPTGGGQIPSSSKAPKSDGWGRPFGYCAYKNGSGADRAGYIRNTTTATGSEISFALVSSGADRTLATSCAQALVQSAQGDDKLLTYSLADVSLAGVSLSGTGAAGISTDTQNSQIACAALGKFFAGIGATGADAGGCVTPAGTGGGIVTDANGQMAASCRHIAQILASPADGEYMLIGVPSDGGLPITYPTYCDFTTSGGRWTLAAKYDPATACPSTMRAGGVCTAAASGIDLSTYSGFTLDLASPRGITGAVRYLKPWREMLFKDSSGGWTKWDCPSIPAGATFGQQFIENQVIWSTFANCTQTESGKDASVSATMPRLRINLTGFRHMTSVAYGYNSCRPYENCTWDPTVRTTVVRDTAGFSGNYYFTTNPVGLTTFPAMNAAAGSSDANGRVCPAAPVASANIFVPLGGTLTNGCAASWTQQHNGPFAFNAGPHRAYDYSTDHPGDQGYRVPILAHLAPQARPDQTWAPKMDLRIVAASADSGGAYNHHAWTDGKPADVADRCFYGYAVNGSSLASIGRGIFFVPSVTESALVYGSGTLSNLTIGFGGDWLDPYNLWQFTGGVGIKEAMTGAISLKTAMIPGGAGQTLCVRSKIILQRDQVNGNDCVNPVPRDWHQSQAFGGQYFNMCTGVLYRAKVEVPFSQMPTNVPLGLVRSYIPVDIREIYFR